MRVLVVNCGSSTLKLQLIDIAKEDAVPAPERDLARGVIERIGSQATLDFQAGSNAYQDTATIADHEEATRWMLAWLDTAGFLAPGGLDAVGHRVVHGGPHFVAPTRLDDDVIAALTQLRELAPLHNEPAQAAIQAAQAVLGTRVPMVAVFDTAFHHTMPVWAVQYAIPRSLATRYHLRRYGFHGLAHRSMSESYATLTATPLDQLKLITLQLGSGCSAAAIDAGRSVDTSMGFTPLEGLMMGTRSGDLNPTLPGFLVRKEGVEIAEVETWLNTRSGLLGVSERSSDMRELLEAAGQGDAGAELAVAMFCYRVRKYIAAYLAVLNGADAILFGGGIGENAPEIRARICTQMDWCGLRLDTARNTAAHGTPARTSTDDATLHVYVMLVDEARIIARDTAHCLGA
jgi:acetate kinase